MSTITIGDWVKINPDSECEYEVARIKQFPHGTMIGIYDEPPSKHVDFWNASSLTLTRKTSKQPMRGSLLWHLEQREITQEFVQFCNDGATTQKLRLWCIAKGIPETHVPQSFHWIRAALGCSGKHGGSRRVKPQKSVVAVRHGRHI